MNILKHQKHRARLWRIALVGWVACWPVHAENVDPDGDGSHYVYCENLGWLNAQPDSAPGLQVDDFELTGWLWGENVGWVSLSCTNTSSCGTVAYGVRNGGNGSLSGFAWTENVGWINFAPATAGVTVDTATGEFGGRAWGENVGWISFASAGATPFRVRTAWNCAPPPAPPPGSPLLTLNGSAGGTLLNWSVLPGATAYEVVSGDLAVLRNSGGDFTSATVDCPAERHTSTSAFSPAAQGPGQGVWFLARGINCGANGSYDSGEPSQVGARDGEIAASGNGCPGTSASSLLDIRVLSGSDDAEEDISGGALDGTVLVGSSDLELVLGDRPSGPEVTQTVGLRFREVTIPPGATITTAQVQFTVDEIASVPTSLTIKGQASDDAPAFAAIPYDISSRETTKAASSWSGLPAWDTIGEDGPSQRTPSLRGVIQEIVNRPGWSSGNALVLIITGSGERVAEAFEGNPSAAPLLHVEFL